MSAVKTTGSKETERNNMASDATLENVNRTLHYMTQLMAEQNKALLDLVSVISVSLTEANALVVAAFDKNE